MKKSAYCLITALSLFTTCALQADTIELADGTLLEGDFIGSSNGIIMFDSGGGIEAFPEDKVVGIFFSSGVATREYEWVAAFNQRIRIARCYCLKLFRQLIIL